MFGPATKAFSPIPLGLVAIGTFFPYIKKKLFFPFLFLRFILTLILYNINLIYLTICEYMYRIILDREFKQIA